MIVALLLGLLQTETARTEHYEVVSTHLNRDYVKHVAETLEAAYPTFVSFLDAKPVETARYRINLYATPEEYEAQDRRLTRGQFASNWAFSHPETGESYIVVQPRGAVLPLLDRTRCLVRHEAFHLMMYRHAPRQGRGPPWLVEGLAELAAEEAERTGGRAPVAMSLKFADAVHWVRELRQDAKLIRLGGLLESPWSWYSESWLFVKYLKEQRGAKWAEFRRQFAQEGEAVEAYRLRASKELLLKCLGVTILELEKDWLAWIDGLKPAPWWRVAGDWRLTKDGVEGAAFKGQSTYLMSTEPLKSSRYRIRAEVQVMGEGADQVDLVLLPRTEGHEASNLVKACYSRTGYATLMTRNRGVWSTVANQKFAGDRLDVDAWTPLELEVSGRTVRLKVRSEVIVEHDFKESPDELTEVRWGVGNYDSWTRFRAIEAK